MDLNAFSKIFFLFGFSSELEDNGFYILYRKWHYSPLGKQCLFAQRGDRSHVGLAQEQDERKQS